VYNHDDEAYSLLKEEGELDNPQGIAFLNSSMLLVANKQGNNVLLVTVEGDVVDVFATVPIPTDVLYLNDTKSVAVTYSMSVYGEGIYFFSVDDYERQGTLDYQAFGADEYIDIVQLTSGGRLSYMCEGENEGEILVTAEDYNNPTILSDSRVWRLCIPNTACRASVKVESMLSGADLNGIVKVEDTYLVAERGRKRVLQCPIGWCCQRSERRATPQTSTPRP
jgi:hypothetical protein